MQNCYVGDIGDFAKYSLLNALSTPNFRLGVVWYLNPDEEGRGDGKFTSYGKLRECDPELFDKIQRLADVKNRNVAVVEQSGIFPKDTQFFPQPLIVRDLKSSDVEARMSRRKQWLEAAMVATRDADLVFLDPDNGIAPRDLPQTVNRAQKHAFLDETLMFLQRGQSLVIYQHQGRQGSFQSQIQGLSQRFRTNGIQHVWTLSFHRNGVRAFLIIPADRHKDLLFDRCCRFVAAPWGQGNHFKLHPPQELQDFLAGPPASMSHKPAKVSNPQTFHRDECETWDGEKWRTVGIAGALEIRRQLGRWPGGRCPACHKPVRPHKLGTTNQRAHFEHLERNPNCVLITKPVPE